MNKLLGYVVSRIKKTNYEFDNNLNNLDVLTILRIRILALIRGYVRSIGFKRKGRIVFIGKKVRINHKKHIELGSGVTIDDYAELDGLSIKGLIIKDNVKIGSYTMIKCTGSLEKIGIGIIFGENSSTGDFCFFGAAGGIEIGKNVIMGQSIRFHSENHNFERLDIPIKDQGVTNKGIVVGDDCWIGSGAVFLDGVTVGNGCVIGANTLVNKNIPPYSVAVGNPMKIVKNRKKPENM